MIVFPNCKINLGLNITAKRADGYHDLETVFYPVGWKEVLEIQNSKFKIQNSGGVELTTTGLTVDGSSENNLCLKAYNLLKKDHPSLPAIQMHLHKTIPMGAGLGGGSADGAFTLKLLNKKFELNLSEAQLLDYALQLGSDCPFFILNKPCFAIGRGEMLSPVELDLSKYHFVIVHPGIHVSTADAFSKLVPKKPTVSVKEIVQQPIETWKGLLKNDFEEIVFAQHPEIAAIKNKLYDHGALYASMSGSGSAVFGIFNKYIDINLPPAYMIKYIQAS
jgi:4-diphosphocytidyl-2-C-methyl-D-erythritol kinase